LSAVTFSSGNPGCQALAPGYFLEDCAGLVVERHDATFGFIHPTVKEYGDKRLTSFEANAGLLTKNPDF